MNAQEFYDACAAHDWFHTFSDDHGVWRLGDANLKRITEEAKTSEEKTLIFAAWTLHMFSGEAWGSPRAPKPERPA